MVGHVGGKELLHCRVQVIYLPTIEAGSSPPLEGLWYCLVDGVIERTFGWFGRYRRLSRDYELLLLTSEVVIYAVMVRLMLARLTRKQPC